MLEHIGGYIFAELNVLDAQLFVQIIVQIVDFLFFCSVYLTGGRSISLPLFSSVKHCPDHEQYKHVRRIVDIEEPPVQVFMPDVTSFAVV